MNVEDIYNILDEHTIYIYGAGYVAKRLFKEMKLRGYDNKVKDFITTCGSGDCIEGHSIQSVDTAEIEEKDYIFIAVHESIKDEIISLLERKKMCNYIWVTPYIFDLMLGAPVESRVNVPLHTIWDANKNNYMITEKVIAAEQYYGINDIGYEIYLRCQMLSCSESTAIKRLEAFKRLLSSWDKAGYDDNYPSKIMDNYLTIDGTHRIASAIFHGLKSVTCDIYRASRTMDEIHTINNYLPKEYLKMVCTDETMIDELDNANHRIENLYIK